MVRAYRTQFRELSSNVKIFLAGHAFQAIGLSIHGLLFSLYLKELGFGESSIGGLLSTASLGISMMAIPATLIVDKFHTKHLVITGMLFASFFYLLQILNVNESALFTFGLLASMFQALFNISVSPFYLRNSSAQQRVYLFTLSSAINIASHLVGYLLGGYLPEIVRHFRPDFIPLEQLRTSIIISLGLIFCANLMFMRIKPKPIPRVKRRLFDHLKDRDWNMISRLIIPKLCFAFGGGLIVPFLNLYLKEKFNFSTQLIGVSYAVLHAFIFAGIFITPMLVSRTTHLKFIVTTSLLSIPFMILMGLTGNVALVLGCFFLRGTLMNMSSPITSIFEMEHVRERECVFASAMIMFCYHLVYMTSTRLGGSLIERYSFGPTFYIAAVFYALAGILYFRFFRNEARVNHKVTEEVAVVEAA